MTRVSPDPVAGVLSRPIVAGNPIEPACEKLVLKERDNNMTIIAALWESENSILLASDSEIVETPSMVRSSTDRKLQSHPAAPLAWGTSGDGGLGIDGFGKWLGQYAWPPPDWDTFKDQVATKIAELNGKQRQIMKLAGVQAEESNLCSALVVGWLDGPAIIEIDDRGIATYIHRDFGFQAIGSGGVHAKLIDLAYRYVKPNLTEIKRLVLIMQLAISRAAFCGLPVRCWRITASGIEKDLSGELT